MKADTSQLIPWKFGANIELLVVQNHKNFCILLYGFYQNIYYTGKC